MQSYDQLYGETANEQLDGRTNFTRKYGWYNSLYAIAQGDITRFENISRLNVHQCLYYLTFEKEKQELESRLIKKNFK